MDRLVNVWSGIRRQQPAPALEAWFPYAQIAYNLFRLMQPDTTCSRLEQDTLSRIRALNKWISKCKSCNADSTARVRQGRAKRERPVGGVCAECAGQRERELDGVGLVDTVHRPGEQGGGRAGRVQLRWQPDDLRVQPDRGLVGSEETRGRVDGRP